MTSIVFDEKFMDQAIRRKLSALTDLESRDFLWFVIGAYRLGSDERWPEVVDGYFKARARFEEAARPELSQ